LLTLGDTVAGCPVDWVSAEGLCYRLVKHPASFQVADQTCSEMDATLLTVESDTESNFMSNWLMAATGSVSTVNFDHFQSLGALGT